MSTQAKPSHLSARDNELAQLKADWLKTYYYIRASFTAAWIAMSLLIGGVSTSATTALIAIYPAWDALANYLDAEKNGGLRRNLSQSLNFFISITTTAAVFAASWSGMKPVLFVFGAWAILAGALQLATAARRWRPIGGQWAMALSGAQSALAGAHFIVKATAVPTPGIMTIIPYAGFGAVYFLVSAGLITLKSPSRRLARVAC